MTLLNDLESRVCPSCWSDLRVVACDECGDTFCRACLEGGICAECREPEERPVTAAEKKQAVYDREIQEWKDRK